MAGPVGVATYVLGATGVAAFAAVAFTGFGGVILQSSSGFPLAMPLALQSATIGAAILFIPAVMAMFYYAEKTRSKDAIDYVIPTMLLFVASAVIGALVRGLVHDASMGYMAAAMAIGIATLVPITMAGGAILLGLGALFGIKPGKDVNLAPLTHQHEHRHSLKTEPSVQPRALLEGALRADQPLTQTSGAELRSEGRALSAL